MSKDNNKHKVDELLFVTARILESEFAKARTIISHYPTSGKQAEDLLIDFLNRHLPKRFIAASGFVLDVENQISKQADILIYDALNSANFPIGAGNQLLFADNLLAIIEVKSKISRMKTLQEAVENIASTKKLKRTKFNNRDQQMRTPEGCMGVIFVYESTVKLETLAKKLDELNSKLPREQRVDAIVVLGKGMITYTLQNPLNNSSNMFIMLQNFLPPACYINLTVFNNTEYSLNLFFAKLLGMMSFIVGNPIVPIEAMLSKISESKVLKRYIFNTSHQLIEFDNQAIKKELMFDVSQFGKLLGRFSLHKWADGFVIQTMQTESAIILLKTLIDASRPQKYYVNTSSDNMIHTNILKGEIPALKEITDIFEQLNCKIEFR